jgi:hypothetical protein
VSENAPKAVTLGALGVRVVTFVMPIAALLVSEALLQQDRAEGCSAALQQRSDVVKHEHCFLWLIFVGKVVPPCAGWRAIACFVDQLVCT